MSYAVVASVCGVITAGRGAGGAGRRDKVAGISKQQLDVLSSRDSA